MKDKKCSWCLKELEAESDSQYCSVACEEKSGGLSKKRNKKEAKGGIFQVITDTISSLFG